MKKEGILSYILLVIFLVSCKSGDGTKTDDKSGPVKPGEEAEISFPEYEYDFGKISEGEKVAHIFAFENKGPGNLVINSATTTCGCTVTKYDRNPIPAGKGGSLEVVFDSDGKKGIQTKTITVHSNSKTRVTILKITADVISDNN